LDNNEIDDRDRNDVIVVQSPGGARPLPLPVLFTDLDGGYVTAEIA